MKKFIIYFAIFVGLFFLASCEDNTGSGTVTYSLGASKVKLTSSEDLSTWGKIENIYVSELGQIPDATISDKGRTIQMIGDYKETDEILLEACRIAEQKTAGYTLKSGCVEMELSALYWSTAKKKIIYSKPFGVE